MILRCKNGVLNCFSLLYWTSDIIHSIQYGSMSGQSTVTNLVTRTFARHLALDLQENMLYWTSSTQGEVGCINLQTHAVSTINAQTNSAPFGIAIYQVLLSDISVCDINDP